MMEMFDDDDPIARMFKSIFDGFRRGPIMKNNLTPMEIIEHDDRVILVQNLSPLGDVTFKHELIKKDDVRTLLIKTEDGVFQKAIDFKGNVMDEYEFNFNNGILEIVLKKIKVDKADSEK
jgi:HSP20 family molecular chaperone IbpA